MLNERETELVLDHAMKDCRRFWERQGYDEREAFIKSLDEVKEMTTDPNSPCGDKLDMDAKDRFVYYRKMDLGL